MPQNFIACDRDQAYLMPPSLLDWVSEDHLVWSILGSVEELDLAEFYADYRVDGHGRPAYDPKMMVALLLYCYARGNRSSRGIERACREDVACRVICANSVPDHSTIAEFRCRHEAALGDLFTSVLSLCRRAGLVQVGVIAIDGMKVLANASLDANASYERIVRGILKEAEETDRREDELFGEARGDELPEQLRTREGRRRAFREAKRDLDAERTARAGGEQEAGGDEPVVVLDLDRERNLNSEQGRRGWMREARKQLDDKRRQQARPIPGPRSERLRESKRRLEEEHRAELAANTAYETYRATRRDRLGRGLSRPPEPYTPPAKPAGAINITDHDSRPMRTVGQPTIQGYNAQAAVNENQIIVAAEVTIESPDFGHLEPMVDATIKELEKAGVTELPQTVVADPGYWHRQQMERVIADKHIKVLIPPDSGLRKDPRPGWNKGWYAHMRRVLGTELGQKLYRRRMATVEPVFGQNKFNRRFNRFQRRGRAAAESEWRFQAATHNLLKVHSHRLATAGP
jgi:transposase